MTTNFHGFLNYLGNDLAKTLGEAVWAFARIEWLTYEYIEALAGGDLLILVGDQNMNRRLRVLQKLVERQPGTE